MSKLVLIRHGQASFGAADYDVLSDLGAEQSRHLGVHFAERAKPFDAIYMGPRKRHAGTTENMRAAADKAGFATPEPVVIDDLDEFPAFDLIAHWQPLITEREPELAAQIVTGSTRAMATILDRWAVGDLDSGDHETFHHFQSRVRNAIDRMRHEQGAQKRIAVVTSGGTISMAVGYALDLKPTKAMSIVWSLANSSVSELLYRDDQLSLSSLNRLSHLSPDLVTTR